MHKSFFICSVIILSIFSISQAATTYSFHPLNSHIS